MSAKRKNITLRKWSYLIPQVAVFVLFAFFLQSLGVKQYWLLSISAYLLLNGYLKIIIPASHRKGLYYIRKGELEGAIFAFRKSYDFFQKYNWLDEYRAFTLFSLSALSYKEMALMNIIYCHAQLGRDTEVKQVQQRLKSEFPNNPYVQ